MARIPLEFGDRLGYAMKRAEKLNMTALGEEADTDSPTISRYVYGARGTKNPDREIVRRLAKALKVEFVWLFLGDDPMLADGTAGPTYDAERDDVETTRKIFPLHWSDKTIEVAQREPKYRRAADAGKPPMGGWKEYLDKVREIHGHAWNIPKGRPPSNPE